MSLQVPKIGRWYQDQQSGKLFEIVALDDEGSAVQVQYVDGEIESLDLDVWAEMTLQAAAAPEDWRTAFELDLEDGLDPDAPLHPLEGGSPLNRIEPETMLGVEEY